MGGKIFSVLSCKGLRLGGDAFKLYFLIMLAIFAAPFLIIVFLPLAPVFFFISLITTVALFVRR